MKITTDYYGSAMNVAGCGPPFVANLRFRIRLRRIHKADKRPIFSNQN